jgi:hypothetical protein
MGPVATPRPSAEAISMTALNVVPLASFWAIAAGPRMALVQDPPNADPRFVHPEGTRPAWHRTEAL